MPLVSFSVACLSCLSFFSPLCRLTAHSLPSSWFRHGWPFLFLLYTSCYKERRIKKGTRTLRTIQKQKRGEWCGQVELLPSLPAQWFYPFLSIHLSFSHTLPRTDIPTAYFENDWTRFVSRHVPVYPSPFSLRSLESCQFRRQHRLAQMFSSFSHLCRNYTYILLLHFSLPSFFLAPCTDIFVRYWGACDYTRWQYMSLYLSPPPSPTFRYSQPSFICFPFTLSPFFSFFSHHSFCPFVSHWAYVEHMWQRG